MKKTVLAFSIITLSTGLTGCNKSDIDLYVAPEDVVTQVDENTWKNQDDRFTNENGEILSTPENMSDTNVGL